jgi:hypothetical protein
VSICVKGFAAKQTIDDRETAAGGWAAVDQGFGLPTVNDFNTVAPLDGAHDVRVTSDTATANTSFFLTRTFTTFPAPGVTPNAYSPLYVGVRTLKQSFSYDLNLLISVNNAANGATYVLGGATVPAGSGPFDVLAPITSSSSFVGGTPATFDALSDVQTYGLQAFHISAQLPTNTVYDMHFDNVSFTDGPIGLPVAISSFSAE